jgi:hypothetical protein
MSDLLQTEMIIEQARTCNNSASEIDLVWEYGHAQFIEKSKRCVIQCTDAHRRSSLLSYQVATTPKYIVERPDSSDKLESSRHSGPELKRRTSLPIWKNCVSASCHVKAMEKSITSVRRLQ